MSVMWREVRSVATPAAVNVASERAEVRGRVMDSADSVVCFVGIRSGYIALSKAFDVRIARIAESFFVALVKVFSTIMLVKFGSSIARPTG